MRAVQHSAPRTLVAFLLVASSLLLVQVVASAQQPSLLLQQQHSAPVGRSRQDRRIDDTFVRGADGSGFRAELEAAVVNDDEDPALPYSSLAGEEQTTESGTAAGTRSGERERARLDGGGLGSQQQQRTLAVAGDSIMHERSSSPAVTSAAPTVFGVSIYLIIAWLALLYLMFRTGSISSTSDSRNYADEIRA